MRRNIFISVCLMFALLLVGCGGGGSSSPSSSAPSSGGGTSGPVATDTLTLSTGSINFAATEFEEAPSPVSVTATISGSNTAGITFGTLPGVEALPSWLDVQVGNGFVNNSIDAEFIITRTDLPEGTYRFTIRAVTFDSSQNVLDTADLSITFEIAAGIPLSVQPEKIDVVMHSQSEPITEIISVTSGNYEWFASSSDANLTNASGTSSQDVTLEIFPPMPDLVLDGAYQGVVDVFQNGTSNNALFFIDFTIFPTLEFVEGNIFFNAVSGSSETVTSGVNLIGQGLNWQVSTEVSWLSFSETSGVIETDDLEVGTAAGTDFFVTVNPAGLEAGRHETVITVTAEADQSVDVPIVIEVAPQNLFASTRGVALSQTGATSVLEAQVHIRTNTDRTANWAALSDAPWLNVTPSGTVNDVLTLTVDPSLLIDETFSETFVTLTSPDAEINQSLSIRVGFWKSALTPSDTRVAVAERGAEGLIVSDPYRPRAYVNAIESEISIVNVYSGDVENILIPSGDVEGMAVSDDGAYLYLLGNQNDAGFIDVVDLAVETIVETWSYPQSVPQVVGDIAMRFGRISNAPYLFTLDGLVVDAETGELVTVFGETIPSTPEVKGDVLCAAATCMDLVTAGFEGARVTAANLREASLAADAIALTSRGDKLFVVGDRAINILDTADMSSLATTATSSEDFVEGVAIGADDTLHVTFRNDGFVPTDPSETMIDESRFLKVFDTEANELATVNYPSDDGGVLPILNYTTISGDNQRVVYLLSDAFPEVGTFSLD